MKKKYILIPLLFSLFIFAGCKNNSNVNENNNEDVSENQNNDNTDTEEKENENENAAPDEGKAWSKPENF